MTADEKWCVVEFLFSTPEQEAINVYGPYDDEAAANERAARWSRATYGMRVKKLDRGQA